MWELVNTKDLVPGEKYKMVHFENYQFIFPWNREYHGRFTHMEYRQSYFEASMERRSYEMLMQLLIHGMIAPAFL